MCSIGAVVCLVGFVSVSATAAERGLSAATEVRETYLGLDGVLDLKLDLHTLERAGVRTTVSSSAPMERAGTLQATLRPAEALYEIVLANRELGSLRGGQMRAEHSTFAFSTEHGPDVTIRGMTLEHDPMATYGIELALHDRVEPHLVWFVLDGVSYRYDYDRSEFHLSGQVLVGEGLAVRTGRPDWVGTQIGHVVATIGTELSQTIEFDVDDQMLSATLFPVQGPAEGTFPTPGPDVIVGELVSTGQFGREGPLGSGTIGMGIGTTSCNKGNVPLNWFALPNIDHPMIPMNMYRLKTVNGADRLEQIGHSWMKHAFAALQGSACTAQFGAPCQPGSPGLGVGCSDPYSAGRNASPCGLGPRAAVNPYTGAIPAGGLLGGTPCTNYPSRDHRDHVHTGISHRIQVLDVDLTPALNPGARYFAEGQYISPHEFTHPDSLAAQNMHNNVSYREVGVTEQSPGQFSFGDLGPTVRESPSLDAWTGATQTMIEPAPMLDGRGTLAYKVTQLNATAWHYEYALYNMNLDRSLGSFSVPIPGGVLVNATEFHAPLNHPPEPHTDNYSNTPWAMTTPVGAIVWSTDSFAVDPNANAVRFGTLYNFRFVANSPPQPVFAQVGLFKTGGTVDAVTVGPSPVGPQDCNNNGVEDGQDISSGASTDCNGNTVPDECELPPPAGTCTSFCAQNCNGNALPDECEIDVNSPAPGGPWFCTVNCAADCNDNGLPDECEPDCNQNGVQDSCDIAGLTSPDCNVDGVPDECEIDINSPAMGGPWFCTANCASDCNDNGVPDECDTSSPDCNLNGIPDECEPGLVCECGNGVLEQGEQCDDGNIVPGDGCDAFCQSEFNDDCISAQTIFDGATPFDTTAATTGADSFPHTGVCQFDGQTYNDLWYQYDVTCDGNLTVSLCSSLYDTDLVVYSGCTCPTTQAEATAQFLACNDDGCGLRSTLTVPVLRGDCLLIRVGGYQAPNFGLGTVDITNDGSPCAVCPNNIVEPGEHCDPPDGVHCDPQCHWICGDDRVDAPEECEPPGTATCDSDCSLPVCGDGIHNALAGEACDTGGMSATCDSDCTLPSCGDGLVNAPAGEDCDPPNGVDCDANCLRIPACGDGFMDPGEQCDDGNTTSGDGCDEFCQSESNDNCIDAPAAFEGSTPFDTTAATTGATDSFPHVGACKFDGQTYNDIWYQHTATCDGNLTISLCTSLYDTDLVVYDGCTCPTSQAEADAQLAACNDDACGVQSTLTLPGVVGGNCYLIRVGGWNEGDVGTGTMEITNDGAPCTTCGNGTVEVGEDCEPPGTAKCDADCTFPVCGDGALNTLAGEQCEPPDTAVCDADCTLPVCGDGIVNTLSGEDCEPPDTAICDVDCTQPICGDGLLNTLAGELCEPADTAVCDVDCTPPLCGDGVLNTLAGEECDDGNINPADGCSAACTTEMPGETCIGGTVAECCDVDGDSVRDNSCEWCACDPIPMCDRMPITFGDMGGGFGDCIPDGFCNVHDRNQALACFEGTTNCDAINIDTGGSFSNCQSDGFCNIHDANHALRCFAGTNPCVCGPAPEFAAEPTIVGAIELSAVADARSLRAGDMVDVRVLMDADAGSHARRPKPTLQSFQLHLEVSGGHRGHLELIDIAIDDRTDFVFDGFAGLFDAYNVEKGQMLAGLDGGSVTTKTNAYLATFTYRASSDAAGTFVVDILRDEAAGDQTFLISSFADKVEVLSTQPAVIVVGAERARLRR